MNHGPPGRRIRRLGAVTAAIAAVAAGVLAQPAGADAPWQSAERIRDALFEAQSDLLLSEPGQTAADVARAREALSGELEHRLGARSPRELRALRADLSAADAAARRGDEVELAAARGAAIAALRAGAYEVTIAAVRRGDVAEARRWLLIRDFRKATRFTRPGVDATAGLDALSAGEMTPSEAVTAVKKDLLDAYQARLLEYLDEAKQAQQRDFDAALAENAALAAGYWPVLANEYERQRGRAERRRAAETFASLARDATAANAGAFRRARTQALEALDGFTAAPFTPEEQARRAAQLTRFLDLVPIEYDRGTDDGAVTIAFEIQEAVAFTEGAQSAFNDLEAALEERDPEAVGTIESALTDLDRITREANEGGAVASQEEIEAVHDTASDTFDGILPEEWKESDTEADFDLIAISLDQMEAAVNAGEREQAEQARLSAYAFFEFGPERLLRGLDPQAVSEVEGLVWYGASGEDGLAELIASDGSVRDLRDTRLALDEALEHARQTTGEGASGVTVITNAALIVFREGLEAILIIAAITASMVGANRGLRRPILRGALLALPASALLFVVSVLVLESLSQYGEKLEAIVGLVAIGVLLLVLNWFFHRVYWTDWIAGHRKRSKALAGAAGAGGAAGATILGLYLLGFSSVLREGFETVLFLQALQLEAGIGIVLAGVSLGLLATAAIGALTFALEQRLPYKRMLVVTGVLISLVLVVLVGNTVRTLQGVGWIGITPLDVEFPLWMGTWLGIFPTVQTLAAQAGALAFVIGSYFLAELVRKRRVGRPRAAPGEAVERRGEYQPSTLEAPAGHRG
jgi:high-affinity iron transporter